MYTLPLSLSDVEVVNPATPGWWTCGCKFIEERQHLGLGYLGSEGWREVPKSAVFQGCLVGGFSPTTLKNTSRNGNLPQTGVKIKNIWNHHLVFEVVTIDLQLTVAVLSLSTTFPADYFDQLESLLHAGPLYSKSCIHGWHLGSSRMLHVMHVPVQMNMMIEGSLNRNFRQYGQLKSRCIAQQ